MTPTSIEKFKALNGTLEKVIDPRGNEGLRVLTMEE